MVMLEVLCFLRRLLISPFLSLKSYQYRTCSPFLPVNLKYCVCHIAESTIGQKTKNHNVIWSGSPSQHPHQRTSTQDPIRMPEHQEDNYALKEAVRRSQKWDVHREEVSKQNVPFFLLPASLSVPWLKDRPISCCHPNGTLHFPKCPVTDYLVYTIR